MAYKVIVDFTDKVNGHVYRVGDKYPKSGRAAKARVEELSGEDNSFKTPLITEEEK